MSSDATPDVDTNPILDTGNTADDNSVSTFEVAAWIFVAVLAGFIVQYVSKTPRARGEIKLYNQGIFAAVAFLIVFVLPDHVESIVFSPLGISIVGLMLPISESIRAVCTPRTEDDTSWLMYWIAQSTIFYCTEWVNEGKFVSEGFQAGWYKFEFVLLLWLLLPYTDGAHLMFKYFTAPFLAPVVQPIAEKFQGWIAMAASTAINMSHLWFLWGAFVLLPPGLKRFITVTLGTVYPVLASIVAVTTVEGADDTFWLTYWSVYGCLYLIMDFLEVWLGKIPGFYTLFLFTTVYLMLPLFRGAEEIFRCILVPLSGQQEMLLLRDAMMLRKDMEQKIPQDRISEIRKQIAMDFDSDDIVPTGGKTTEGGYQSIDPINV